MAGNPPNFIHSGAMLLIMAVHCCIPYWDKDSCSRASAAAASSGEDWMEKSK